MFLRLISCRVKWSFYWIDFVIICGKKIIIVVCKVIAFSVFLFFSWSFFSFWSICLIFLGEYLGSTDVLTDDCKVICG